MTKPTEETIQDDFAGLDDDHIAEHMAEFAGVEAEFAELLPTAEPEVTEQDTGQPETEQSVPQGIPTNQMLAPVIKLACEVLAPNWNVKPQEQAALADVYGALMDKYLPDNALAEYSLELTAIVTTAAIFGARANVPRHVEKTVNEEGTSDGSKTQD